MQNDNDNEVVTPEVTEEVVEAPVEEGKPEGEAVIVEDAPADSFPADNGNATE